MAILDCKVGKLPSIYLGLLLNAPFIRSLFGVQQRKGLTEC